MFRKQLAARSSPCRPPPRRGRRLNPQPAPTAAAKSKKRVAQGGKPLQPHALSLTRGILLPAVALPAAPALHCSGRRLSPRCHKLETHRLTIQCRQHSSLICRAETQTKPAARAVTARRRHHGHGKSVAQQLFRPDRIMRGGKEQQTVIVHSEITFAAACIRPRISYMLLTVPTCRRSVRP